MADNDLSSLTDEQLEDLKAALWEKVEAGDPDAFAKLMAIASEMGAREAAQANARIAEYEASDEYRYHKAQEDCIFYGKPWPKDLPKRR